MEMSSMSLADLLPALDAFLEAAAAVTAQRRKAHLLAPLRAKMEAAMQAAFKQQGAAFMRRFARLKPKFPQLQEADPGEAAIDWGPLFDEAALETLQSFSEPLDLWAAQALLAGARQQIGELKADISFDLKNPRAVKWLKAHGAERVTQINDTTRQVIHDIVVKAVAEGQSYDNTAAAITERFAEFAVGKPQEHIESRAHLVALTESANAYESGNRMVVGDLMRGGLTAQASWLSVGDSKVSDGCRANQAQGWIPADQPFQSGHMHAPRFPGCRCCTLYRRKPNAR
jgi:hypothetical protein